LNYFKNLILDTLFPINCLSCSREGDWLCQICRDKIKICDIQLCPLCEREITLSGKLCSGCKNSRLSPLDQLITAASYENSLVKQLIHNLKYRFVQNSAKPLATLMHKSVLRNELELPDMLIPIPLHPRRLRWRGFNQSEALALELAKEIAAPLSISVVSILNRKKLNRPQMGIKNYRERLKNVIGIFALGEKYAEIIKNKKVLLVDDIATTGATLQEAAKVLKEGGAKKVMAIVIARQTFKKS
jgi:competence protein ComFC